MKELYSDELPKWLKLLGVCRVNKDSIDFKWGYFAPKPGLELILHRGQYFDTRYYISFCLGWGKFNIKLPFRTHLAGGSDMPRYGLAIHSDTIWLYIGGKYDKSIGQMAGKEWIAWDLPWFTWNFESHEIYTKNSGWRFIKRGENSWEVKEKEALFETYHYVYTRKNGEVQNREAKCSIERRTWHRKWLPFIKQTSTCIDIEFNDEVGERTGSWKGGVIGTGYEMLEGDTIEQTLRRMEKERKF